MTVEVPALAPDLLGSTTTGEPSGVVRARVVAARERQRQRCAEDGIRTNAELTPALMARDCPLDRQAMRLLHTAVARLSLSARGYDRIRKVARTIADLSGAEAIHADHVAEALQFRMDA